MSGGSYNYAYQDLDELDRWYETLKHMAERCKAWAVSDDASKKFDRETKTHVASTMEDRARIMVRGMLLERAADRLKRVIAEIKMLKAIMHDVEWVASGDYGIDDLMTPLETGE